MGLNEFGTQIGISKNKFVLLDCEDEVDPHELLKQQEILKEAKKKARNAEKANPAPKTAAAPKAPKPQSKPKPTKTVPETIVYNTNEAPRPKPSVAAPAGKPTEFKENRPVGRQGGYERPPYRERNYEGKENQRNESGPNEGRGERRGGFSRVFTRGGNNMRGRGSGPGYDDRRVKREYDRHSGSDRTGVKPVDKRRGEGPYNTGPLVTMPFDDSLKEEIWNDEKTETTLDAEPIDSPKGDSKPPTPEPPKEEELTLEEYKKLKSSRPKPEYNIRKPGEGEDLSQWKNMVALDKKLETETDGEELEYGEFPQRVGRQKRLQIQVNFNDRERRGGGRGGRGGSYRGGPTHHHQVSEVVAPPPSILDEKDFPSLK